MCGGRVAAAPGAEPGVAAVPRAATCRSLNDRAPAMGIGEDGGEMEEIEQHNVDTSNTQQD